MKNKKTIVVIAIILAVVLVGTAVISYLLSVDETKDFQAEHISLSDNYKDYLWDLGYSNDKQLEEVERYNSDVSVAFERSDRKTELYMFSSPIRYYNDKNELVLIDTRISNADKSHEKYFAYQTHKNDLVSYYPKCLDKGVLLEGSNYKYSFGLLSDVGVFAQYQESYKTVANRERQNIKYESAFNEGIDLNLYPSRVGTNAEIEIAQPTAYNGTLDFWIDTNGAESVLPEGGYVVLQKGEESGSVVGVIQSPILIDAHGKVSTNSSFVLEQKFVGNDILRVTLDKEFLNADDTVYPVKCYISFELKRSNQPDSAVFSSKPSMNSYLAGFNTIGQSADYGKGEIRVRFKVGGKFGLVADNVYKAYYKVHSLTKNDDVFEVKYLLEDWCSQTGTWAQPIKEGKQVSTAELIDGSLKFEVTQAVKQWCNDSMGMGEQYGLLLKSLYQNDNQWNLLSSNDSALYNNVLEVIIDNKMRTY